MKKIKQIEKEFDERFVDKYGMVQVADRKKGESGLYEGKEIKSFYNAEIKQIRDEVATELFRIKAGFPLSDWGKKARGRMNELIEKLERIK